MSTERTIKRLVAKANRSGHTVTVVLGSSVNGLSYVRSLGRRGVPVLCVDTLRSTASTSRYGSFELLQSSETDEIPGENAADAVLMRLVRHGVRPVVLASADEWQWFIARRDALGDAGFLHLAPSLETIERIIDKQAQYQRAVACGVPVAAFANAGEVWRGEAVWKEFPAIIKPRRSFFGREAIGGKATLVRSPAELNDRMRQIDAVTDVGAYLVQKVVEGGDSCLFAYLGCLDQNGTEVAHVIKQKLRQHPPSFGDGSLDVTCEDVGVRALALELLRTLNYRGLVGVEFKRDSTTGSLSLIEINPRTVSTNQLAITAGVDFPWIAYQLARGQNDEYPIMSDGQRYRIGCRHVHEEREFRGFLARRRCGDTGLVDWLGEILRADSYAIWSWRDPLPFGSTVLSGFRRRLAPKSSASLSKESVNGEAPKEDWAGNGTRSPVVAKQTS